MPDLVQLIQEALAAGEAATAPASKDLVSVTVEISDALNRVTGGAVHLSLEELEPAAGKGEAFALLLHWNGDERAIRVLEMGRDGYPIKMFGSLLGWRERSDLQSDFQDRSSLEKGFRDLVSARDSDVLAMIRFIIGNSAKQPAATS